MPIKKRTKSSSSPKRSKRRQSNHGKIQMNVAVLGSSRCGKTSVVKRFLSNSYSDKYNPTLMDVFEEHFVLEQNNVGVEYRIFDVSGSDDFPAMKQLAVDSADTFVIVYAVDDRKSFEDAKKVKMEIMKIKGDVNGSILLVANKCDVDDNRRVVSSEEGKILSIEWDCLFVECSAKSAENIESLFIQPTMNTLKQKYPELIISKHSCPDVTTAS